MSWDNPVSPIDAKNSIGFFVQFFLGQPGLLGDSVYNGFTYFKTAADSQDYDFFLFIKHRYKTLTYKNWVIKKKFLQK